MTIYIDNGKTVKIYPVKSRIAKAIMTLLEMDEELVWSETHEGYGVAIVDKTENALKQTDILNKMRTEIESVIQKETIIDHSGGEYESISSKLDPDDVLQIIDKYREESEK